MVGRRRLYRGGWYVLEYNGGEAGGAEEEEEEEEEVEKRKANKSESDLLEECTMVTVSSGDMTTLLLY